MVVRPAVVADRAIAKRPQAQVVIAGGTIGKTDRQGKFPTSGLGLEVGLYRLVNGNIIFSLLGVFLPVFPNLQFDRIFSRILVGVAGVVTVTAGIAVAKVPFAVVIVAVGVVVELYPQRRNAVSAIGVKIGLRPVRVIPTRVGYPVCPQMNISLANVFVIFQPDLVGAAAQPGFCPFFVPAVPPLVDEQMAIDPQPDAII